MSTGGQPISDFGLLRPFLTEERARRIEEVLAARTCRLILVAENLYDPHNLSAILRTADSLGLQEVILTGSAPESLNSLVALGAERWLTIRREPSQEQCMADLKARGFTVAGAALSEGANDAEAWDPPGPVALVVGNEREGLSKLVLKEADALLRVPLCGFARSLNVSVAAGILLWELLQKPALRDRGLPPEIAAPLRDLWARQAVENSGKILRRMKDEGGRMKDEG